jgi:hypothetical protein
MFEVHHFPTVGEPIKLKNSVGSFATPSISQTVEKLAPENQRRKGGGSAENAPPGARRV